MMKKVLRFIKNIFPDLLMLLSAFFIACGVYMIYIPAGYITVGLCLFALAYFYTKGADDD